MKTLIKTVPNTSKYGTYQVFRLDTTCDSISSAKFVNRFGKEYTKYYLTDSNNDLYDTNYDEYGQNYKTGDTVYIAEWTNGHIQLHKPM